MAKSGLSGMNAYDWGPSDEVCLNQMNRHFVEYLFVFFKKNLIQNHGDHEFYRKFFN